MTHIPASTQPIVTLTMENFLALPIKVLQAIEGARIQTWTRNEYVLVGLTLPEFHALLAMFPRTPDLKREPITYSGRAGEA